MVEHILQHRELFAELHDLGCIFIVSAVESVDDTILGYLDKGHVRADVVEALEITRAAGIPLRPSLLPFTPWTTVDGYLDLLDFVEEHDLVQNVDSIQYAIRLLVPPGSALLGTPQMDTFLGALDQDSFSYRWTHPDPRLDSLHQQVSRLVETAVRHNEDPLTTFYRIKGLALTAAMGRHAQSHSFEATAPRQPPPRLTEAWFC
jgi:hypothetical protein